jgi:hypothetical protein
MHLPSLTKQLLRTLPTLTMVLSDVPTPVYTQDPFFSTKFRAMIVTGTYFVYLNEDKKQQVGRIIEARKAFNGFEVTSNIFIAFSLRSSPKGLQHPIEDEMANNLNEIVLTPRTIKHLSFDDDVVDLAFVFTKEQLLESGAYLDGITNAYICRFEENGEPVNGLMPFLCPLP